MPKPKILKSIKEAVNELMNARAAKKKPKKKKTKAKAPRSSGGLPQAAGPYVATLNDPFEHAGVRMGFGTMVETQTSSAYVRLSTTANADGSFGVVLFPSLQHSNGGGVYYSNAGAGTATWQQTDYANSTAITTLMAEARVVSGAVRLIPQIPATSAPGVCYTGNVPALANNDVTSVSINSITSSPCLKMGVAAGAACAKIYPVDPTSFAFFPTTLSGFATNSTVKWSTSSAVILMTGLPASCPVTLEAVLNLEGICSYNSAAAALQFTGQSVAAETLATSFPNPETMWTRIRGYLSDPGLVSQGASALSGAAAAYSTFKRLDPRGAYFARGGKNMLFSPYGSNLAPD